MKTIEVPAMHASKRRGLYIAFRWQGRGSAAGHLQRRVSLRASCAAVSCKRFRHHSTDIGICPLRTNELRLALEDALGSLRATRFAR